MGIAAINDRDTAIAATVEDVDGAANHLQDIAASRPAT
jgi:hypothetical protein